MKKRIVLILIAVLFLGLIPFISAGKGGGKGNHGSCSSGKCCYLSGYGDYKCDPSLYGVPVPDNCYDNPCCTRSYCSGTTCATVNFDRVGNIPNLGFTCPGQHPCSNNNQCDGCVLHPCPVPGICQAGVSCSAWGPNENQRSCTYTNKPAGTPCGTNGQVCTSSGTCCTPNCAGKVCGDDSCGGSCGTCDYGLCASGTKCYNSVDWTNMIGVKINNTYLNNRVKLIFSGHDLTGEKIDYEIREKGTDSLIWSGSLAAQSSTLGYITWRTINGTYYFKARVNGKKTTDWFSSVENPDASYRYLTVSTNEMNSAPVAKITNPKTGEVYLKELNVSFNQSSFDIDDYINYSWNLDDLKIYKGSTENHINYNLTDTYSVVGQKNINLSVIDERGLTDQDHTSILIIDPNIVGSKYVFAGISKPLFGESLTMIGNVEFDANDSYSLEVTSSSPIKVMCLGGKCPTSISGVSPANYDNSTYYNNFSIFNFSWRFDDGSESGKISGNTKYSKGFPTGDHFAVLEVALDSGEKSSTIVIFKYTGGVPENCQEGGTEWVDTLTGVSYSTAEANGWCLGNDHLPETSDDCCPKDGHTCQGGASDAKCSLSADCIPIPPCSNYTSESNCTADKCGAAQRGCSASSSGGIKCAGFSSSGSVVGGSCNCYWDNSASAGQKCKLNISASTNIADINIRGSGVVDNISYGECSEGQMVLTQHCAKNWENISAIINKIPGADVSTSDKALAWANKNCEISGCFSGTKMVVCDDNSIRLGFFNWINAFVALILVAIIYIALDYSKKLKIISR